ncbi:hypothetical protein [Myxacorys almedinensis]|nr:hypothetical protein [Myxacorys almedinensis]
MRWIAISSVLGVIGLSNSVGLAQPGAVSAASAALQETQPAPKTVETLKRLLEQSPRTPLRRNTPKDHLTPSSYSAPQPTLQSKPQQSLQSKPQPSFATPVAAKVSRPVAAVQNAEVTRPVAAVQNSAQPNSDQPTPRQPIHQPIAQATSTQEFLQHHRRASAQRLLTPAETEGQTMAQADPSAQNADTLRQKLIIDRLVELRPPAFSPGSTVGTPTAFGANYGDAFVGLSLSNRRPRINEADGALSAGFGLGDSEQAVGLEVSANIGSLRRFGRNGDIGLKLHRALPGKAAIALGYDSGITWGEENRSTVSTLYGVASKVFDLRPSDPDSTLTLTASLGLGGGRFRSFDNIQTGRGGVGVFGSVGVRVIPQGSVIASWTGQDLNLGVSYVPIKTQPLFLTAVIGNVFSRNDNATLFSLGIGYGFNYAGYQY